MHVKFLRCSVILTVRICTYVRTYKSTYDLPYVHVCSQLYLQIRAIYVQHTAQIVLYTYTTYQIRTWTYMHVHRTYVHVYDFNVAVCWVDWSRMWMYFQWIRADTDTLLGTPTVRIWTYIHVFMQKYVHIRAVYARIFDRNTVRIFAKNTCTCIRSMCCHGCFAFTGAGASLCTFAARLLRQVCRATAQAHADRQIQSYQVCATDQRKLAATCTGVPRTTELRRRWPTAETLILGFLDPTAPKSNLSKHRKSTQTFMVLLKQSENGMT